MTETRRKKKVGSETVGYINIMAPATNWLSFSLSPMEMLRSSDQSTQFMAYDNSSTVSPQYLIDNFYANGNNAFALS